MYSNEVVKYYPTFESREEEFRSSILNLVPRKYAGALNFWTDFTSLKIENLETLYNNPIAYLTCRPQDSLAFGTASQVLRAALLTLYKHNRKSDISLSKIISDFSLEEFLEQPIRTISGGESVKLALAKLYILSEFSNSLTISSPFSWLASDNKYMLDIVLEKYSNQGKCVKLMALDGEDTDGNNIDSSTLNIEEIKFTIRIKNVDMNLGSSISTDTNENICKAFITDFEHELISPCLFSGNNGQGKSMTAYILSRAVEYNGEAVIETSGMIGFAKMLFQDIFNQKLLRSFDQLSSSLSSQQNESPNSIYKNLLKEFVYYFQSHCKKVPIIGYDEYLGTNTLLEIKFILVASRLSILPNLLILDEPDWGFTKETAIGFVLSVVKISHSLGIPVAIISHKNWWSGIIKSTITTHKESINSGNIKIYLHEN